MTDIDPQRKFQFWEYRVSHGQLLIRSPKGGLQTTNTDIVFSGVEYLELPRHLGKVKLQKPSAPEVRRVAMILGRPVEASELYILVSEQNRFLVVAANVHVKDNELSILNHSF